MMESYGVEAYVDKAMLGLAPGLHEGRLSRWDAQFLTERFNKAGAAVTSIAYPASAVSTDTECYLRYPPTADEQRLDRDFDNRHED